MGTTTADSWKRARVLIIGAGGLGGPIGLILAREGVGTIGIVDDDVVEESNLHRQIQFRMSDIGRPKISAMAERLRVFGARVELHSTRFVPRNAASLVREYDLVVEATDNFATKFLSAEAAKIESKPIIHSSAIRWVGTIVASAQRGCYSCLFESAPDGAQESCELAGVMGPVVGLTAALTADLARERLEKEIERPIVISVDGKSASPIRRREFSPRRDCHLCREFKVTV